MYLAYPVSPPPGPTFPALHHFVYNTRPWPFFHTDKIQIIVPDRWLQFIIDINYNGPGSDAFRYLAHQMAGVFQEGYPKFQSCAFAGINFDGRILKRNRVVVTGLETHRDVYARVRALDVREAPPVLAGFDKWQEREAQIQGLISGGWVHWYTGENGRMKLSDAPKDGGRVFVPILRDWRQPLILYSKLRFVS